MAPQTKAKSKSGQVAQTSSKNDPRFASITSDPRFRLPSAKQSRINVDKRFDRMFKDDEFSKKASVDRYGRKLSAGTGRKELERFYRLDEEDKAKDKDDGDEQGEDSDEGLESDDEVEAELRRVEARGPDYDPARQGGFDTSSDEDSSSDEESEDEVDVVNEVEFPDQGKAEVPMGEVSRRLAAVNLDWDNIRAADLMAVATSFAPTGARVESVVVYPSEYGRERLEREELEGPPRDIFASSSRKQDDDDVSEEEDSDDEEERIKKSLLKEDTGEEFDSGKLRQYQLDRLKYYYAIITCDNEITAKALYDDMDGREYLTTANFFDLRFVPDEVSFDTDVPRDECTKLPAGYKPNEFVTDALTHSKVKLTWDADDTTRKEVQKRAFSRAEIDENDLRAYIGSDSESDDEDAAADHTASGEKKLSKAELQRQKMRAALGLTTSDTKTSSDKKKTKDEKPVGDMQITFTSGLSSAKDDGDKKGVFENEPVIEETTRERYIRKEKERKQRRKEKMKASHDPDAAASDNDEPAPTGSLPAPAEENEDLGFNDPFFADDPSIARQAATEKRKAEKAARKAARAAAEEKAQSQRAELELLMTDDKNDTMRHFDMNEIAKAEKLAGKKGKKGKKAKGVHPATAAAAAAVNADGAAVTAPEQEAFRIETQDPRFKALFESHEFAIDPTNPRFKATSGMKELLEEGRKKRKNRVVDGEDDGEAVGVEGKRARRDGGDDGAAVGGSDLQSLMAKVKAKTRKR